MKPRENLIQMLRIGWESIESNSCSGKNQKCWKDVGCNQKKSIFDHASIGRSVMRIA